MKQLLSLFLAVVSFSAFSFEYSEPGFEGRLHQNSKGVQIQKRTNDEWIVGQVGSYCTGTLIGPRHVLTAASCVYNLEDGSWTDDIGFHPGKINQRQSFREVVMWKRVFILKEYMKMKPDDPDKFRYDLAVIELDEDLGDLIGWRGFRAIDHQKESKSKITVTGYPEEKEPGTMWTINCPAEMNYQDIFYFCQSWGGMPGAGLTIQREEDNVPFIIGVHSVGFETNNIGTLFDKTNFKHVLSWVKGTYQSESTVVKKRDLPYFVNFFLQNNCSQKIQVVLKWRNHPSGVMTKKSYIIQPGQEAYVFDTSNQTFYLWAMTEDGKRIWQGNHPEKINRTEIKMKEEKILTSYWGYWIHSLDCD